MRSTPERAPCRARCRSTSRRPPAGSRRRRAARAPSPESACLSSRSLFAFCESEPARSIGPANPGHVLELGERLRDLRRLRPSRRTRRSRRARARRGSPRAGTARPCRRGPRARRAPAPAPCPPRSSTTSRCSSVGRKSRHHPVRDDPQRPERDERRDGRDQRRLPVAGAGRHADRRDEPERRRRRQAAHGETLPDDRARAEEADPGHDLRRDPRRVERDRPRAGEKLSRTRRRRRGEERRAERDEQVRAKPRLALAQLALETDRTAERSRDERARERRRRASEQLRQTRVLLRLARSPRSRPTRGRAARRARSRVNGAPSAVACTSTSRPSPVITTFMSTSALESSVYSRSSSGSPSTIPTETAATDPASACERPEPVERAARRDVRAGDRRAARAAVGLEHVAVEPDRPLAERLEVDDRRGARARSAAGSRPCGRPACPRDASRCDALARRRRQQRVLGRQPAAALVA